MINWAWLLLAFFVGEIAGWMLAAFCFNASEDERLKVTAREFEYYRSATIKLVEGIQEEDLEKGVYPSIEAALVDAVRILSR